HELRLLAIAPQCAPCPLPGGWRRPGHALRRAVFRLSRLGELAHAPRALLPEGPEVGLLAAVVAVLGCLALRWRARSVPAAEGDQSRSILDAAALDRAARRSGVGL